MSEIYRYILETDSGMAPCIDDGLLSLATCKPGIRRMARVGDWVAGFMPGSEHRGELVWAGRVEQVVPTGQYQRAFPSRADAVYRQTESTFEPLLKGYHCDPQQQGRDTGNPVLVFSSRESWYFGSQPRQLPDELRHLDAAGRGYRVNFRQPGDLPIWENWLSEVKLGKHGTPRDKLNLCAGCICCGVSPQSPRVCGTRPRLQRPSKQKQC